MIMVPSTLLFHVSRLPLLIWLFGDSSRLSKAVSAESREGLAAGAHQVLDCVRLHSTIATRLTLTMKREAKPPPYHISPT